MENKVGDRWYRFVDTAYAPSINEFGERCGESIIRVRVWEFEVVKVTPKGVQLVAVFGNFKSGDRRFVNNESRKRYACPTKELAKKSFLARKKRQLGIYKSRYKRTQQAIDIVNRGELDGFKSMARIYCR